MLHKFVVVAASMTAAVLVGACAVPENGAPRSALDSVSARSAAPTWVDLSYTPPARTNGSPAGLIVNAPIADVTEMLRRNAVGVAGVRVVHYPELSAFVATYSGAAAPYVDCGVISYEVDGVAISEPATAQTILLPGSSQTGGRAIVRRLSMDARTVMRLRPGPDANQTTVATDTTFVVSRRFEASGIAPAVTALAFGGEAVAEAQGGLICRATGRFEQGLVGRS